MREEFQNNEERPGSWWKGGFWIDLSHDLFSFNGRIKSRKPVSDTSDTWPDVLTGQRLGSLHKGI